VEPIPVPIRRLNFSAISKLSFQIQGARRNLTLGNHVRQDSLKKRYRLSLSKTRKPIKADKKQTGGKRAINPLQVDPMTVSYCCDSTASSFFIKKYIIQVFIALEGLLHKSIGKFTWEYNDTEDHVSYFSDHQYEVKGLKRRTCITPA
jgi:hypothetical protein